MLFQHRGMKLGSITKSKFHKFSPTFCTNGTHKNAYSHTSSWDYSALQFHYGNFHFSITQNYLKQFPAHPKTLIPFCQREKNKKYFLPSLLLVFEHLILTGFLSSTTLQTNLLRKGKDKRQPRSSQRITPVVTSFSKLYLVPTDLPPSISRTFIYLSSVFSSWTNRLQLIRQLSLHY